MGKKPGGSGAAAGWLATVRKVFKNSKDQRHSKKVHPALARVLIGSLLDKVYIWSYNYNAALISWIIGRGDAR